ncbi:hypothetical protein Dimus_028448 [Dionaea muscipula]
MAGILPTPMQMLPAGAPAMAPMFAPLPSPVVVVGPQFVVPYPVTLVIKKRFSMSGGQFTVTDVNGTVIFTIKRTLFADINRLVLHDAAGIPLVTLRQKILSPHSRWKAYRGDSTDSKDLLFSAKKSSFLQLLTKLDVFLAQNTDETAPDFHVEESFIEHRCTIYIGKTTTVIAQMQKHHHLKTILLSKDIADVTVSPGVDYTFMAALIVMLHQIDEGHRG